MASRHDEYEALHRHDTDEKFEHEELQRGDELRAVELVHARAIYLGSGVSEHPCGLPGHFTFTLVSDEVEDLTCPACKAYELNRIARMARPMRDEAADALAAGLGYTHARPSPGESRTPCGVRADRGMSGNAGEPRIVSTRPGDHINCPGCIAVIGAVP